MKQAFRNWDAECISMNAALMYCRIRTVQISFANVWHLTKQYVVCQMHITFPCFATFQAQFCSLKAWQQCNGQIFKELRDSNLKAVRLQEKKAADSCVILEPSCFMSLLHHLALCSMNTHRRRERFLGLYYFLTGKKKAQTRMFISDQLNLAVAEK